MIPQLVSVILVCTNPQTDPMGAKVDCCAAAARAEKPYLNRKLSADDQAALGSIRGYWWGACSPKPAGKPSVTPIPG